MAGKQLARITVLTPEIQRVIIEALAVGSYLTVACEAAGISRQAFDHWRKRCEDGDPNAQGFADFFAAVKKASGLAELSALQRISLGTMNWQSAAWYLERRFPKRWGRKAEAKQRTQIEAPAIPRAIDAPPEYIAEVLSHLERCSGQPGPRGPLAAEVEPAPADAQAGRLPLP
jgi:hypothetical protein